jgi:epoxide hydrolase-like predicted phosphatase
MKKPLIKKIRAVVFDFGGVIELWGSGGVLRPIAESIGVPVSDFTNEYFKHNHLSNVGNITWEEMLLRVVERFTDSFELKTKVLGIIKDFQAQNEINSEILAFFPILRACGYKVAIFSNATSQLRIKLKQLGIDVLVDEVVVSGEIGFQKPHKEAFQVLFERLGVNPEEVVFIDDARKSLEKADEIGYTPILFRGNEQLKVDLRNLGINL